MREILKNLEIRVASLERQSNSRAKDKVRALAKKPQSKNWDGLMLDFKTVGLIEPLINGVKRGEAGGFVYFIHDDETLVSVVVSEVRGKKKIQKWFYEEYNRAYLLFDKLSVGDYLPVKAEIKLKYPRPNVRPIFDKEF